jgi:hypothetical protein
MGATQTQLSRRQILWQSYREAFRQFEREAVQLSKINAKHSSDPAETEHALACVEQARLAFNETRDALAASMMSPELARFFHAVPPAARRERTRVRTIAELLWELNGRPQGSADDDWYRAERVVRYAEAEACCAR